MTVMDGVAPTSLQKIMNSSVSMRKGELEGKFQM